MFFAPPYDLDRPGPTAGSPAQASANRDTGEFSADLPYDVDAHGFRAASASIVMAFEVNKVGTLLIRLVHSVTRPVVRGGRLPLKKPVIIAIRKLTVGDGRTVL